MKLNNYKELQNCIRDDQKYFYSYNRKRIFRFIITNDHIYQIKKYMKFLRKEEYFNSKKGIFALILELIYARKKNVLGNKLGFYIRPGCIGKGAIVFHHGTIIIHGNAIIGENCKFHGDNCIGNNGVTNEVPNIGNGVDIGFGAKIIGPVTIADNCKIGAGAIVTKSCLIPGSTLVGNPAKIIINKTLKGEFEGGFVL